MEQIIHSIILLVLIILEIMLYFILVATVAPKLLKNRCSIRASSDRGLKKYVYPSGRGIAYEPHPSIRKYIHRYLLFTESGYKYVKCKLDASVEQLNYSIVMFNNRNRVIDMIDVEEQKIAGDETQSVTIHPDTSYIALYLDTVNGVKYKHEKILECKLWQLAAFVLSVGVLSLVQMIFMTNMLHIYDTWWIHSGIADGVRATHFVLPAVEIGVMAGVLAFLNHRKKGVRWSI